MKVINLPASLASIGEYAFIDSGLLSLNIPKSVKDIGEGAFASCHSLTTLTVENGNTAYESADNVLYNIGKTYLHTYAAGASRNSYTTESTVTVIGTSAFYGSHNLIQIKVNIGVTEIAEKAFFDCVNAINYDLPETLQSIASYAFANNTSLPSLNVPDSVIQIRSYAFDNDLVLTSVVFKQTSKLPRLSFASFANTGLISFRVPANVSTISQYVFDNCKSLSAITFVAGNKLESVSAYLFDGCSALRTITFENDCKLTSIQARAFENLYSLKTVNFGDCELTNIDNYSFRNCSSLTSINIPEGVVYIGRYAFYGCDSLSRFAVPSTVEYIGEAAFCAAETTNVYFSGDILPLYLQENWDYGVKGYYLGVEDIKTSGDWQYAQLTSGNISIVKYTGNNTAIDLTTLDLDGDIISIGGYAFYNSPVESIVLPETLTSISAYAFSHSKLASVSLPSALKHIGSNAFSFSELESVNFGGDNLKVIEQFAFAGCASLTEISIPNSVNTLGSSAFFESGLETVELSNSLSRISELTFAATKITSVALPDSVSVVCDGAFRDNPYLQTVSFGTAEEISLMENAFYNTGLTSLTIPSNVTGIAEYCFSNLSDLQEINVAPDNAVYTSVDGILYNKSGKKIITVPAGRTKAVVIPASVEIIGFGSFEDSAVSSITFAPDSTVTTIGYRAFFSAKNITHFTVPKSVRSLDYYSFAYCTSLENVIFEEGSLLSGVYEGAFYGCTKLNDITLPETVVEISDYAFYGCMDMTRQPFAENSQLMGIYSYAFAFTGIKDLRLPSSVVDVDVYAFKGSRLETVYVPSDNAKALQFGLGIFNECDFLTSVTLPFVGSMYESEGEPHFAWIFGAEKYTDGARFVPASLKTVTISEGITEIGTGGFTGLSTIETLNIPKSVVSIEAGALTGLNAKYILSDMANSSYGRIITDKNSTHLEVVDCRDLDSLEIPEHITSISFSGYCNISDLVIPSHVTTVSFNGCEGLKEITFTTEEQLSNLDYRFRYSNINSVVLAEGIEKIPDYCFANSLITNIVLPDGLLEIGDYAFDYSNLNRTLIIPDSVTSIGKRAFQGTNIWCVELGSGLQSIGNDAFGCSSLIKVINHSNLDISFGVMYNSSIYNSNILVNTEVIVDKNGNSAFRWNQAEFELMEVDDFLVKKTGDSYEILGYLGNETAIEIPDEICGSKYTFKLNNETIESVILPDGITEITEGAFANCTSLKSVILPKGITEIPDAAFACCRSLKNIIIPSTVTRIGHGAFIDCSSLVEIDIPGSVLTIGAQAFQSCSLLEEIIIPDSVTEIGLWTFVGCSLRSLTIGKGLKEIPENAFSSCRAESLVIPGNIIKISSRAFAYSGFNRIYISGSVNEICSMAFDECINLEIIEFSDDCSAEIRDEAFLDCTNLKTVILGNSSVSFGNLAFSNCNNLSTFEVDSTNENYRFVNGMLFNGEADELLFLPSTVKNVVLPDTITVIPSGMFKNNSNIVSITLSDAVTTIEHDNFINCSGLKYIYFGKCLSEANFVGDYGYTNPEIVIPQFELGLSDENTDFKLIDGVLYDYNLTKVILASKTVTRVVLPDTVTEIGDIAFWGCINLTEITSTSNMEKIGSFAFYKCEKLSEFIISSKVTVIGMYAFANSGLTSVIIPESVTSVDYSAFYSCIHMKSVVVESADTVFQGELTFAYNTSLTSVNLPEGLKSIPYGMFSNCSSLKSIDIPSTVVNLEIGAFENCTSLISIVLPDGITSINSYTFLGCSSLNSIILPSRLKTISDYAFGAWYGECGNLAYIHNNSNISLTFGSEENGWVAKYAKAIIEKDGSIRYADGSEATTAIITVDAFDFSYNGSSYELVSYSGSESSVTLPKSVNGNPYTVSPSFNVKRITLPSDMTEIYDGMFEGCFEITELHINAGIVSIGENAFSGCASLSKITVAEENTAYYTENNVLYEKATDNVLYISRGVTELLIRLNITSANANIYSSLDNVESLVIGKNVTSVDISALSGWSVLSEITVEAGNTAYFAEHGILYDMATGGIVLIPKNIDEIIIREGITTIKSRIFVNNDVSTSLVLPNSLISYERNCLFGLNSVRHITIGSGLTSVDGLFDILFKLERISVSGGTNFKSVDGVLYSYDMKTIVRVPGKYIVSDFVIPDSVTKIANHAFFRCSITSVTVPGCIKSISESAFENSLIHSIILENGIEHIEQRAFDSCHSLTEITMPDSLSSIGNSAFNNCVSLREITIPNSVTSIGDYAFNSCRSLESITMSNSITSVGENAFTNTAYYEDSKNRTNGMLCIGHVVIEISDTVKILKLNDNMILADGALVNAAEILFAAVSGESSYGTLSQCQNIQVLQFTSDLKNSIRNMFSSRVPSSLKTVIINEGCEISSGYLFNGLTDIQIFVCNEESSVVWNDLYPNWNNNNDVLYGKSWIFTEFYDHEGNIWDCSAFKTSKVIRAPYVAPYGDAQYSYMFKGWDINADGKTDTLPATSSVDIIAVAIVERVVNQYTVQFLNKAGEVISSEILPYGASFELIDEPTVEGYTFNGWYNYPLDKVVTGDITVYSSWKHMNGVHSFDSSEVIAPTCTEQGYEKHLCSVCGEFSIDNYTDALGHNYTVATIAPTCDEDGYDLHTCSHCGDSYRDNVVAALGHTFGDWIVDNEPKCEESGSRYHICSVCNECISEELVPLGHNFKVETIKEATCLEAGEVRYTCLTCEHTHTESVPLAEHNYIKVYVSEEGLDRILTDFKNAEYGYEKNGEYDCYYYKCDLCDSIKVKAERVGVAGVSYFSARVSTVSTCSHIPGDWVVYREATTLDEGVSCRKCQICNEIIEMKSNLPKVEHIHSLTHVLAKSPACTVGGNIEYWFCITCNKYFSDSDSLNEIEQISTLISALNHDLVHHESKAATCTEHGWGSYDTCTRCDHTTYQEIPATGHTISDWIVTKEATCTEAGSRHKICTVCNAELEVEAIPATGHNYGEWIVETEPTCTEAGLRYRICANCNSREEVTIPATGHTISDWIITKEATCTEAGNRHKVCTVCNAELEVEAIPATGHTTSDWIVTKEATDTEPGSRHKICTVCGAELEVEEIPAKGVETTTTAPDDTTTAPPDDTTTAPPDDTTTVPPDTTTTDKPVEMGCGGVGIPAISLVLMLSVFVFAFVSKRGKH